MLLLLLLMMMMMMMMTTSNKDMTASVDAELMYVFLQ